MRWIESWKADPQARVLADRHYNRQKPGARQFVPPGPSLVLRASTGPAFWITSAPFAEYVRHRWAGAWVCSAFRNEGAGRSSELIREACAASRAKLGEPPTLGMVTFVDPDKVRHKRDPGRCFRRAGFVAPPCPVCRVGETLPLRGCASCDGTGEARTEGGLVVLQLWPAAFPEPAKPLRRQGDLFAEALAQNPMPQNKAAAPLER